tara:strand:- start:546 stop:749 length:204 start_codon:yes stop_codon:yes gene_type:complete
MMEIYDAYTGSKAAEIAKRDQERQNFIEMGAVEHKQALEKAAQHRKHYEDMIKRVIEECRDKNTASD